MNSFDVAAILLAAAALLVVLLRRLRQSAVVAYLLLGVLAGPAVLDLMPSAAVVSHLAELGVVLLLFFLGLEFDVRGLKRMAGTVTIGAGLQVALTTAPLLLLARWLGLPWGEATLLAFCLALSSTTVAMQVFAERKEADSAIALESMAVAIGQDLLALLALAAAVFVAPVDAGAAAGGLTLFLPLAIPLLFLAARLLLPRLFARIALAQDAEALGLASLAACLCVAAATQHLGASLALGAFLAGMVFADTPWEPQIRADLSAIQRLALGLFFVSIGLLVDPRALLTQLHLVLAGVLVIGIVKGAVTIAVLRVLRRPWSIAGGVGLALAQVSEFAFVLAASPLGAATFAPRTHEYLVLLTATSMLCAPLQAATAHRFGQWLARRASRASATAPDAVTSRAAETLPPPVRVIVVGYGPVGRTLCRILLRHRLDVTVIDLNPATVERLKRLGRSAVFGDAAQREVLDAAGVATTDWLVVTLPDLKSRAAILATARALRPGLAIVSRARYLDEQSALERLGADQIAYEEAEVAAELARLLLTRLPVDRVVLDQEVAAIRAEIAVRSGFSTFSLAVAPATPPPAPPTPPAPS